MLPAFFNSSNCQTLALSRGKHCSQLSGTLLYSCCQASSRLNFPGPSAASCEARDWPHLWSIKAHYIDYKRTPRVLNGTGFYYGCDCECDCVYWTLTLLDFPDYIWYQGVLFLLLTSWFALYLNFDLVFCHSFLYTCLSNVLTLLSLLDIELCLPALIKLPFFAACLTKDINFATARHFNETVISASGDHKNLTNKYIMSGKNVYINSESLCVTAISF